VRSDFNVLGPARVDDAPSDEPLTLQTKWSSGAVSMHLSCRSSRSWIDDPEQEVVWSGLKPHAGWRLAAFCAEGAHGSSRTHEFANRLRRPDWRVEYKKWGKGPAANRLEAKAAAGLIPDSIGYAMQIEAGVCLLSRVGENEVVELVFLVPGSFTGGGEERKKQLAEVVSPYAVEVMLSFAARLDEP
jgi:hypothetical protein